MEPLANFKSRLELTQNNLLNAADLGGINGKPLCFVIWMQYFCIQREFYNTSYEHDSSEGIEGYYRQGNNVGKIKEGKPLDAKLSGLKNEK